MPSSVLISRLQNSNITRVFNKKISKPSIPSYETGLSLEYISEQRIGKDNRWYFLVISDKTKCIQRLVTYAYPVSDTCELWEINALYVYTIFGVAHANVKLKWNEFCIRTETGWRVKIPSVVCRTRRRWWEPLLICSWLCRLAYSVRTYSIQVGKGLCEKLRVSRATCVDPTHPSTHSLGGGGGMSPPTCSL